MNIMEVRVDEAAAVEWTDATLQNFFTPSEFEFDFQRRICRTLK